MKSTFIELQSSEEKRTELVIRAEQTAGERQGFAAATQENSEVQEWIAVYSAASSEKCINQKQAENAKNAICKIENNLIVSLRNEKIKIESRLNKETSKLEENKKKILEFAQKYPYEKRASYAVDHLIEILAPEWQAVESNLLKFSFELTDVVIQSTFERVNLILAQYRIHKTKNWRSTEDTIIVETKANEKYEQLRGQYVDLLGLAIKVIFNHASRTIC